MNENVTRLSIDLWSAIVVVLTTLTVLSNLCMYVRVSGRWSIATVQVCVYVFPIR